MSFGIEATDAGDSDKVTMRRANANLINSSANCQMNTAIIISESELRQQLSEIVRTVVSEIFDEIKNTHPPLREVMTMTQLADYWQVTKQSVMRWTRRENFPLPVHYVGGDPRFHLTEVNQWSKDEAAQKLSETTKLQSPVEGSFDA